MDNASGQETADNDEENASPIDLYLKEIAMKARNAEYNPRRFAAVIVRIREPKTTALIFKTGKLVCTGAKSEKQARLAARMYARIVEKVGFEVDFQIHNIVGSIDVKFPVRLENLKYAHSTFTEVRRQECNSINSSSRYFHMKQSLISAISGFHDEQYEPEIFPGLIYRMASPKVVLLVFVSGKVVFTGAKSREDILKAFQNIYPVLEEFKKH